MYAFTGSAPAAKVHAAAAKVLKSFGHFEPSRGDNFYPTRDDPETNYVFEIEVYPKQDFPRRGWPGESSCACRSA